MIRSYRTKRRRVQQELKLLNYSPSSNNNDDSIPSVSVNSTTVQPEFNVSAQNSPEFHNNISNSIGYNLENESVSYSVDNHSGEEILHFTSQTLNTTDHSGNCYCSVNNDELSLRSLLSSWVIDFNVPHTTVNALLHTLRRHRCIQCLKALPLDTRTLLNSSSTKISSIRSIGLGKYHHFGLKEGI